MADYARGSYVREVDLMADIGDDKVQGAFHAILAGDPDGLRAAVAADPELVAISWGENTLLEWTTQPPHGVTAEVIDVLISEGSRLDRALNLAGCWNLAPMVSPTARRWGRPRRSG